MEHTTSASKEIIFGGISGMVCKIVEFPFDLAKVRLQSQPDIASRPDGKLQYSGAIDCLQTTVRQNGVLGLYQGLSSPLVGAMFENAVLFLSYSKAQEWIRKYNIAGAQESGDLPIGGTMLAGAISGAVTSIVLTPIELIKCRLQVQNAYAQVPLDPTQAMKPLADGVSSLNGAHTSQTNVVRSLGPLDMIKQIYRQDGLGGLWRGQFSTLIRESLGSCCWFSAYELTSKWLRPKDSPRSANTFTDQLLAGAAAGITYNALLYPVDSIKSRTQTGTSNTGFIDACKLLYKTQGVRGFFRGLTITLVRAGPSNALIFLTYETLKKNF